MNQDERRSLLATQLDRATTAGSLARAALLVAMAEDPELDARACMTQLAALSERVRLVVEETGQLPWRALARVLGEEEGFRGDFNEYDAPSNSFLHQVLDTRRGLPILLSILWVEVARGAGIRADGVGLPGHFVAPDIPLRLAERLKESLGSEAPSTFQSQLLLLLQSLR